jgi:hypothetical protein
MNELSARYCDLLASSFAGVFAQRRTRARATELALGTVTSLGRRTISRAICARGRAERDWSADYKLYSRSPWAAQRLFDPVLRDYLERFPDGPVVAGMDDTKLWRTGRQIKTASWQRDPLSPPFHTNMLFGLRFMQTSLLFPHHRQGDFSARGYPVRFTECPVLKKPGKRASTEEREAWRQARKTHNLSRQGLAEIRALRARLDELGAAARRLLVAVDGSLCNRTIFGEPLAGVDLIGRCRKDARLCWPAPSGGRAKYDAKTFTPAAVERDDSILWRTARLWFGGARREIRYKELKGVLWRRGAGTRPLRLFVLAPTPYKVSPNAATNYREPAYLLCTDLESAAAILLQAYLDRWQIEVNHRDEKDIMGVGQAQVWAAASVERQPAFAVACYSLLLLAGLIAFGPGRGKPYLALPKWRKRARRASALDTLNLLRYEMKETCDCDDTHAQMTRNLINYAYT